MARLAGRIESLSADTRARLHASTRILSLSDAVLGLVKNSLDAGATALEIVLDLPRGFCSVLDNGSGILGQEFQDDGGLGKPYHTSRLQSPHSYGRFGCFLHTLSSISLVSIYSSSFGATNVNSVVLKDGERVGTGNISDCRTLEFSGSGTKVTVYNLFEKVPVRAKQWSTRYANRVELEKDTTKLKANIIAFILAGPHRFMVNLVEQNSGTRCRLGSRHINWLWRDVAPNKFDLQHILSAISDVNSLPKTNFSEWREVHLTTSNLTLTGAFHLKPTATKSGQFISIDHQPVTNRTHPAYDEVNKLFERSTFGDREEAEPGKENCHSVPHVGTVPSKLRQSQSPHTSLYRRPIFYLRINTVGNSSSAPKDDPGPGLVGGTLLPSLLIAIQTLTVEFLKDQGFWTTMQRPVLDTKPMLTRSDANELQPARVSTLDAWPRIKSAHRLNASDFVSGLPFISSVSKGRDGQSTAECFSSSAAPGANKDLPSNCITWTDPRSGKTLALNPRTGMALPEGQSFSHATACHHGPKRRPQGRLRNIDETGNIIRAKWNVQSFDLTEMQIPSVAPNLGGHAYDLNVQTGDGADALPLVIRSVESRVTRDSLRQAEVVAQLDGKFVLGRAISASSEDVLILIDQHAADERIQVEALFARVCNGHVTTLSHPIDFELSTHAAQQLDHLRPYLSSWGVQLAIGTPVDHQTVVSVLALPEVIAERCRTRPQIVIDLILREIRGMHDSETANSQRYRQGDGHWLSDIAHCPQGIVDLLISRACRSAIMFNDVLSTDQMQSLIEGLGNCLFPFQCAHGRPSVVVLMVLQKHAGDMDRSTTHSFHTAWRAWNQAR